MLVEATLLPLTNGMLPRKLSSQFSRIAFLSIGPIYARVETFDIPQNVPFCVDVVRYTQEDRGPDLQIWDNNGVLRPSKLEPYRKKYGTYRFSVLVSADDIAPERIDFKVTCDEKTWPPCVEGTTSSNSS